MLNQGDIEIADGQISIGSDFIINGGKLATNENFFLGENNRWNVYFK